MPPGFGSRYFFLRSGCGFEHGPDHELAAYFANPNRPWSSAPPAAGAERALRGPPKILTSPFLGRRGGDAVAHELHSVDVVVFIRRQPVPAESGDRRTLETPRFFPFIHGVTSSRVEMRAPYRSPDLVVAFNLGGRPQLLLVMSTNS